MYPLNTVVSYLNEHQHVHRVGGPARGLGEQEELVEDSASLGAHAIDRVASVVTL